jgi:hypothetical protein
MKANPSFHNLPKSVWSGPSILPNRFLEGDGEIQLDAVGLYVQEFPKPSLPWILQRLSTVPTRPAGPYGFWMVLRRVPSIATKVHPEYTARNTLCATTNQNQALVLVIGHALFPRDRLYVLKYVTVTTYVVAIVSGTLTSRAPLYSQPGISNGGAKAVDPVGGGNKVRGSLLGGNVNSDEDGEDKWTLPDSILLDARVD